MRILQVVSAGLALTLAVASAAADTLVVGRGGKYGTIGEAVAAASPGDRIVVKSGRYDETVTVSTPGLQFVAKGKVRWFPADFGQPCLVLSTGADGVSVTKFTFGGRGKGISATADDLTVQKCEFIACATAVEATGARIRILRSRSHLCYDAFILHGDDLVLDRNTVAHTTSNCVTLGGERMRITRNVIHGSGDDYALDIDGNDALVEGNRIWSVWNDGVRLDGDRAAILRNRITEVTSDDALEVNGNDARVEGNLVSGAYRDGIHVTGDNASILDNQVRGVGDDGIEVRGESFQVRGNRVWDCSDPTAGILAVNVEGPAANPAVVADNDVFDITGSGIEIQGIGIVVEDNRVRDCVGRGIETYGLNHRVARCLVTSTARNGFEISSAFTVLEDCISTESGSDGFFVYGGGSTLVRCVSFHAAADGLQGAASDVTFTDCTFLDNGVDVCASPGLSLIDGGGNHFETGGVDAPPRD